MTGDGGTNAVTASLPVILAAGLAAIGFIIRSAVSSVKNRFDSLERSFTRVVADLAAEHTAMESRLDTMDRRLTRVESWKELVSLPDTRGRARRVSDRAFQEED